MKKAKNAKKSTAYAIALGLALMAPVALAATHDSTVTSDDMDSDVSVAVTGSNIAVFANGSSITLGNSSAPGTVSVTAGSAESPLTATHAYAIASQSSGSITIYGDAVTLGVYNTSGYAYGQYISGSETINSITANSLGVTASTANGSAYAIYNVSGSNTVNAANSLTLNATGLIRGVGISNSGTNTITAGSLDINASASRNYTWGISNSGTNEITADSVLINASSPDQAQGISNTGTNTITATGNVSITAESTSDSAVYSAWGINNTGTNTITGDSVTITATSAATNAYALVDGSSTTDSSSTTVNANTIEITADAPGTVYAVASQSGGSVTLGSESSNITINATTESGTAIGIMALAAGSTVTVNGESLTVNSTSTDGGTAFGIHAQNNTQTETAPENAAHVIINAENTYVTSTDLGLSAFSNGQMDINGNLTVTADHAIDMRGYSTMNINTSETNTVKLTGNIAFETPGTSQSSGTIIDANLNLNLTTSDSYWTGNTLMAYPSDNPDTDAGGLNLKLSNGATWNVTNVSDEYTDDTETAIVKKLAVTDLTSDGGVISLTEGGTAAINAVELGENGITVNVSGDGGSLEYDTMTGDGGLTKTGDGTLTLAADTAYTGATNVNGGTLDVGGITMASTELNISDATFVTDDRTNFTTVTLADGTYDGSVTNAGVSVTSSGTSTITGDLTLSNNAELTVSDGTLTTGVLTSTDSTINNSGTISVTDASLTDSTYTGGGTLTATGTATLTSTTVHGTINAATITTGGDTVIYVGSDEAAGTLIVEDADLNGTQVVTDPVWSEGGKITDGSYYAQGSTEINGRFTVGRNSLASFGSTDQSEASDVFDETGLTWGEDVTAAIYIAKSLTMSSVGGITIDGTATTPLAESGAFKATDNSLTMIETAAAASSDSPAISGVTSVNVASTAKLYINNAQNKTTYYIFSGTGIDTENNPWYGYSSTDLSENVFTNNKLIAFKGVDSNSSEQLAVYTDYKSVAEVLGSAVVIPNVADAALTGSTDTAAYNFFSAIVDSNIYPEDADSVEAINSAANLGELAGVNHGMYSVTNQFTDSVTDHLSLKTHDKNLKSDIWVDFLYSDEDIDGMSLGGLNAYGDADYRGFVLGADLLNRRKTTFGLAFSYASGDVKTSNRTSYTKNEADYYGFSLYGRTLLGQKKSALLYDLSYMHGKNDIRQDNTGSVIEASPSSDAISAGLRAETEISLGKANNARMVPYAGLRYMHIDTGSYSNTLGMNYSPDSQDLWLATIGAAFNLETKTASGWTLRPRAEIAYVWNIGDTDTSQTVWFGGVGDRFAYDTTDDGSFVGKLGFSAEKDNLAYGFGFEYQKGDDVESKRFRASLTLKM